MKKNNKTISKTELNKVAKEITNKIRFKGEKWKRYPLNNSYYVSNYGRVLSRCHRKLLNHTISSNGYYYVTIGDKKEYIHRIVAITFCDNPENKSIVHHINSFKFDNRACNLMWVTAEEHKELHKTMKKGGEVA